MSESCTHDCGSCGSDCGQRVVPQIYNDNNKNIKKVIAVMSGKGGVGKSMVTSLLAVNAASKGNKVAIMDADITGPSIPKSFGINEKAMCNEAGTVIYPGVAANGIKIMSMNLLMDRETDPVIWRGPVIASAVKEFWNNVEWGDTDIMFVDCPPGTGDVPLTIFQSLPVAGIVVVTSPQELVSMIVGKAVNMAKMMNIPVLGLVENMSYFECPDCGKRHNIFGESNIENVAAMYSIDTIARLPVNPAAAAKVDEGKACELDVSLLDGIYDAVNGVKSRDEELKIAVTYDNGTIFQHFGHSENFKIYETKGKQILNSSIIGTDGNGHEALAGFLNSGSIDVLICGGIGQGAINALSSYGIKVVPGAAGDADAAVNAYLAGQLSESMQPNCNHHEEGHSCSCHGDEQEGHSCGCHDEGEGSHSCGCHS